jgi:hypothetical protein
MQILKSQPEEIHRGTYGDRGGGKCASGSGIKFLSLSGRRSIERHVATGKGDGGSGTSGQEREKSGNQHGKLSSVVKDRRDSASREKRGDAKTGDRKKGRGRIKNQTFHLPRLKCFFSGAPRKDIDID